jgi:uncharacterized protein (TIGR02246 family)
MRWTRTSALIGVFMIAPFSTVILSSPKQVKATVDESTAVMSVINGFTDAFNHHDAHALAMWFTEDADFTNVGQVTSHGRKDIEEHFVPRFAGFLKNSHRTYTVRSIRFLTPEVTSIAMDYELTGTMRPNGTEIPPRKGLYDWIVTKQNGKWLINVLHESELAQAPAVVPVR